MSELTPFSQGDGDLTMNSRTLQHTGVHDQREQTQISRSYPTHTEATISMDKRSLCRLHRLLKELRQGKDTLAEKKDSSLEEWQQEIMRILPAKSEAQQIVGRFTDDYLEGMVRRTEKRRKMRLRKKRQLEGLRQEHEVTLRKRSQMQADIDGVLSAEMKAEEKKKQDGELQKEIDSTLSEVRLKKKELLQQQNLYRALRKLRQIRLAEGRITVTAEHHEKFEHGMREVEEFVRQRSLMCREEERTMQVMLVGERDELRAKEDERTLRKKARLEAARMKKNREILFGEDPSDSLDGQSLVARYYTQASDNLQSFIEIRRQWDAHITADAPHGSTVPLSWVVPVAPSSKMWAAALSGEQE